MGERRRFGHPPIPAAHVGDRWMLETPEGVAVLNRIRANVYGGSAVDVDEHARRVALDVLNAKQRPRPPYGRPSLVLTRSLV